MYCLWYLVAKSCPTLETPWTVVRQAPLSMGFSRQEYWLGCHAFFQGIFLTQRPNPSLLSLLHCRQILCPESPRKTINRPCCCSVAKSCLILCNPIDGSTPGFPVLHYLPKFAQIHVLSWWYYLTISSSATLFSFAFNLYWHQGLFHRVGSLH